MYLMNDATLTARVPGWVRLRLNEIAKARHLPVSRIVYEAVLYYLIQKGKD